MSEPRVRMSHDDRRELIVRAAVRVFATKGYDEVSTSELAKAAGTSRGLLNHYFPTKRDLYLAAVRRFLELPELPVPAYVEGATVEERVRESVRDWLDFVDRNRATWLAAVGFAPGNRDDEVRQIMESNIERTADRICEITGLGQVRSTPVVAMALHGYAWFAISVTRKWLNEGGTDREAVETLLSEVLISLARQHIPAALG